MENQDTSAAIYSEAKSEYTKQLVFNFQPSLLRFFLDRFAEAKAAVATTKSRSALSEFQESLSQIPEWNMDKVQRETAALLQTIHCDYVEDLITAVFIAHTKILSAIRLHAKPRRKINITVPKPEHFMHRALSECSRLLWSNVYLFSDSGSSLDQQKNTTSVNRFLEEGILQAVRNLLPVKSILRDSLQEDDDDGIQIAAPSTSEEPEKELPVLNISEEVKSLEENMPVQLPEGDGDHTIKIPETDLPTVNVTQAGGDVVAPVPLLTPVPLLKPVAAPTASNNTLVIDTEKSVGFTGVDAVFGDGGHAELKDMVDEGSDEFKILGESEELDLNEFEDIDELSTPVTPAPLSLDDYETL
jgi:hypothetical protein